MTRQVALGAVIAFAVTVLVLSVWTPSCGPAAPPPPAPPQTLASEPNPKMLQLKQMKPSLMRQDAFVRAVRGPMPTTQVVDGSDASVP